MVQSIATVSKEHKSMKNLVWLLLLSGSVLQLDASSFLDGFIGNKNQGELRIRVGDKKEEELASLKAKLLDLQKNEDAFMQDMQMRFDKAKQQVMTYEQLPPQEANSLVPQLLLLAKASVQILTTIKTAHKELISIYKEAVALLEGYVRDPQFEGLLPDKKALYDFQELQSLSYKVGIQEDKVRTLKSELAEVKTDLASLQKKLVQAEKVHQEKVKEQTDFGKVSAHAEGDVHTQSELLDIQVRLAEYERQLLQVRIQEQEARLVLVTERLSVEEKKRVLLTQERDLIVRVSFRVDKKDVQAAQEDVKKEQQLVIAVTDRYVQKIDIVTAYMDDLKKELADAIYKELLPIQEKRKELEHKTSYVDEVIKLGGEKARMIASETIREVKEKMGLL